MKILFPIGTLYPSQQGGPSNTVYWMAKALSNEGVEVSTITTNIGAEGKIPANKWLDTEYGRVIYHSAHFPLLPWNMIKSTFSSIPHCDLVHITSLFYPPSLVAGFIAYWYGKPIIWSPRGELDRLALVYSTWKKRPFLWLIRLFLSKKVIFHSTCPEETLRVKTVIGEHTQVVEIPNFLELPKLIKPTSPSSSYLLYIGRIHPKKAIEKLITALSYSPTFISMETILIIAGDSANAYGEQLKTQAQNLGLAKKVQFIGHVEGEAKQKLYANAYYTILPSNTENFGNVVVESLAQGTPVIASTGTPWAILEEHDAGYWVDNTPSALSEAIDKALGMEYEEYLLCRKNALLLAYSQFDIAKNFHKWTNLYKSVISSSKSISI